jgi:HAD superfamily hydrolase (TIGR01490 family)
MPEPPVRTVVVFDLDGTLTVRDSYLGFLAAMLAARPVRWCRCWRLPFDVLRFKLGRRDNGWLKSRFLAAVLGGLTTADTEAATRGFVERLMSHGLRPGALAALRRHIDAGDELVLLSASPDLYVPAIAERLGISVCLCTRTARDRAGRITGALDGSNCRGAEKIRRLQTLLAPDRAASHVIAYADHRSDLPLLAWADDGVLVNPSAALARLGAAAGLRAVRW